MRLVDLFPRWVHPNIFAFLCPHCRQVFLTCKNVPMSRHAQCEIFWKDPIGESEVVPCKPEMAWNFPSDGLFSTLTVTPSLDASASGHWHGWITSGEIK
jgi:hypothetical protein